MSLGHLSVEDRENPGPPDLLAAVDEVIVQHTPEQRSYGWETDLVCSACEAHLSADEAATHVVQQLWQRGYLTVP